MKNEKIQIVECPRDAMQGLKGFIPTEKKANYINSLIRTGFNIIDFGSFVSHTLVPQMRDTSQLVSLLDLQQETSLLSIILNKKGAVQASQFEEIKILGYPLSISEVFQKKNSNMDVKSSLRLIDDLQNICIKSNKILLIYFSMAFGNPYGEKWDLSILLSYIDKIQNKGIQMISLADTIGSSTHESIKYIYGNVIEEFSVLDVGVHLHSNPTDAYKKIDSAWSVGCRRFDVAINGYGGCPFAQNKLVGNIATEKMLNFLADKKIRHSFNLLAFENACNQAKNIFNQAS